MKTRFLLATSTPWETAYDHEINNEGHFIKCGTNPSKIIRLLNATDADREFIAHSRQDMVILINELENLYFLSESKEKDLQRFLLHIPGKSHSHSGNMPHSLEKKHWQK